MNLLNQTVIFMMNKTDVLNLKKEAENHLVNELLPFWTTQDDG